MHLTDGTTPLPWGPASGRPTVRTPTYSPVSTEVGSSDCASPPSGLSRSEDSVTKGRDGPVRPFPPRPASLPFPY